MKLKNIIAGIPRNRRLSISVLAGLVVSGIYLKHCGSNDRAKIFAKQIQAATTKPAPGTRLAFLRLSNNAVLNNVRVEKVEGDFILISPEGSGEGPYWINLSNAVSFQPGMLSKLTPGERGKDVPVEEGDYHAKVVSSVQEIATVLSDQYIATPSGRPWEELGDLERQDWIKQLTAASPDFWYPATIHATGVSEQWGGELTIDGELTLQAGDSAVVRVERMPAPAGFRLPSVSDFVGLYFLREQRETIARIQAGQIVNCHVLLRPIFWFGSDRQSIDLSLRAMHRAKL